MKESSLQDAVIRYLRGQPRSYWNVNHGSGMSGEGRPDIEGCYESYYVTFELKKPGFRDRWEHLSDAQVTHASNILRAGGHFFVIDSVAEAIDALKRIRALNDAKDQYQIPT